MSQKNYKPRGHNNFRKDTIEDVAAWWISDKAKGRLCAARVAPKDYENLRPERLKKAMNKKLPKLQSWKNDGARSVLVLENRDMALSNDIAILESVEHALEDRTDRPDEVWLF